MKEYRKFNIDNDNLIGLLKSKTLSSTYYKLLKMLKNSDDIGIIYLNLDTLAKDLNFKTRSGCWKALCKLEKLNLLTFKYGVLFFNNVGIYYG